MTETMKIRSKVEYDIDAELVREEGAVLVVVHGIDVVDAVTDQLPPFFRLRDLEEIEQSLGASGFDGLEHGIVIDVLDPDTVEGMSDRDVLDAYFNSPYGVA